MAGRSDPPEGIPPEGLPNSGDDDYPSVVFDESFVRAARLQESSASERVADHAPAVRPLPPAPVVPAVPAVAGNGRAHVLLLVLLVVLAFGTAIWLGVRTPVPAASDRRPEPLRATLIPLAPTGEVPGGTPAQLLRHSPAAQFRTGAEGIQLPVARGTAHFSESQVLAALTTAKDYLVQSSVDPGVLTGKALRPVRILLDPDQLEEFDASFADPRSARGERAPAGAGWLVRFDPADVALAGTARVSGTLRATEIAPDVLDVIADHTFVYPLRPATGPGRERADGASLFTVRRELRFRYDAEDLRRHRTEVVASYTVAGPHACAAGTGAPQFWQPLLAGRGAASPGVPAAKTPAPSTAPSPSTARPGTDPYTASDAVCGTLAPHTLPTPPRR
ncbi:SCO2583 family membrane protein [Streptomyces candidus]|uniref:Uncharacterized protein n=1 Tax=Streptomyces candidus TaxID=67283 RepID=A0A7X0HAY6_9ACTN|nr:hypothetical protein [Streptomyces candidus]MBB6434111.1 hypothetical protein [Streptomyces candidus]GHH33273.1 hypothetical protein GCM10018773_03580 [Streptomyces candidus]